MHYSITWGLQSVCVNYFGNIDNRDIEGAHFALNGDARFYECRSLILDISDCNMDKVSVDNLLRVMGTDLGASVMNDSLKVAMIAVDQQNKDKASQYIDTCRSFGYPWEFRLFDNRAAANAWLDS